VVTPGVVGSPDQHESVFGEVGVVSVPLKATSSENVRGPRFGWLVVWSVDWLVGWWRFVESEGEGTHMV
jgi:hypothetical protein